MERPTSPADEPDLPTLVGLIVDEAGRLVDQQVHLLRVELRQELRQAGGAAASLGAGAALTAAGGLFGALMLVHGLHRATRLPLWGCYGMVGGLLGTAGLGLLAEGRRAASGLSLAPRQTAEALKENLAWIKDQAGSIAATP